MNLVDSCGWLEYFAEGANASFFKPVLLDFNNLIIPSICIYEVFRRTYHLQGRRKALVVLVRMKRAKVVELSTDLAAHAATLGLKEKLALADSIVLATARRHKATLWTQDAHFAGIPGVQYRAKPST